MNYLKKLKNRSVFLWKALFRIKNAKKLPPPVYIDRASVQPELPGAQTNEMEKVLQTKEAQRKQTIVQQIQKEQKLPFKVRQREENQNGQTELLRSIQPEERHERVLRGVEQAETAVRRAVLPQKQAAIAEPAHQNKENTSAQMLLKHVREMAQSGIYPQSAAVRAEQSIDSGCVQKDFAAPEEWSAYFEKDARRYDGACEVL